MYQKNNQRSLKMHEKLILDFIKYSGLEYELALDNDIILLYIYSQTSQSNLDISSQHILPVIKVNKYENNCIDLELIVQPDNSKLVIGNFAINIGVEWYDTSVALVEITGFDIDSRQKFTIRFIVSAKDVSKNECER
jgi:hypothetical protein